MVAPGWFASPNRTRCSIDKKIPAQGGVNVWLPNETSFLLASLFYFAPTIIISAEWMYSTDLVTEFFASLCPTISSTRLSLHPGCLLGDGQTNSLDQKHFDTEHVLTSNARPLVGG